MMQKDLGMLERWCDHWETDLNIKKCTYMCFTGSIISTATYRIKNYELEQVDDHRYVRVNFSNNLK